MPPGDPEIRAALLRALQEEHATQTDTAFIHELGLCRGRVRVDLAVVNGLLHGYEIKSDRDSLRRLAAQVDLYGRVLDRATLVVGASHAEDAIALVPDWWEVLVVEDHAGEPGLVRRREGRANPTRDARALVELLWLDEAVALLECRELARGVRGKPRRIVWDRVCEHLSTDEIAAAVRGRLKATAGRRGSPL